jgi:hypothetical protein
MACIFPGARDLPTYWNNILGGVDAIGEPLDDWGAKRYLDSGRIKTQYGGFLRDLYRFASRAMRSRTPATCAPVWITPTPASCSATAPICTAGKAR